MCRNARCAGYTVEPLIVVSNPAVCISAVKLADDRSGDVIVRFFESEGARAEVTITAKFRATSPRLVDLLERDLPDAPAHDTSEGELSLTLRPFQLVTVRFPRA